MIGEVLGAGEVEVHLEVKGSDPGLDTQDVDVLQLYFGGPFIEVQLFDLLTDNGRSGLMVVGNEVDLVEVGLLVT